MAKEKKIKKQKDELPRKSRGLSESAKNKLQWGLLAAIPLTLVIVLACVFGSIYSKSKEHNWVSAVVYEKEFKEGRCAWMWCYADEYNIYFEYDGKRAHANVNSDAYYSIEIGETIQYCLNHGEVKYHY